MKVKQRPDDFRVEELTDFAPAGGEEPFALYRLTKTGWTTPDALGQLQKRLKLRPGQIGFGGLKDRHAVTTQHVTIEGGSPRNLPGDRISLDYLGQVARHFESSDIRANRFAVRVRHLTSRQAHTVEARAAEVGAAGVPNYFDDQRFGSVGADGRFVGRELVLGNFEEAVRLALAAPSEYDNAEAKATKATLRGHWGDWAACKAKLPRGHARSLVDYLVGHPADFKGVVARLRPELGGLYLAAYQSHLWNRTLDGWLRARLPPEDVAEFRLKLGAFAVPRRLPPELFTEWHALALPLPSARLKESSPELDAVLAAEGLTLGELRVKGLQKPFFAKQDRAASVAPAGMTVAVRPDELNARRVLAELNFELGRGAYATMVLKWLTAVDHGE